MTAAFQGLKPNLRSTDRGREYQREYYLRNREKKIAYQRKYHSENSEKINRERRDARIAKGLPSRGVAVCPAGTGKKEYNRTYHYERQASKLLKIRVKALQIVSGLKKPKCIACGCDDIFVLCINHKNGGGRKDHSQYRGSRGISLAIVEGRRGSADLDVRCHNCNIRYEYERGQRGLPRDFEEVIKNLTEGGDA